MKKEPKIVIFDLETLPDLMEVLKYYPQLSNYPGQTIKAQLSSIICFAYRIYGEKKTQQVNAWDFNAWKKDVNDDRPVLNEIQKVFADADAIVTQNGKRFDEPVIQTRLKKWGMDIIPPRIAHIDTKQLSKSNLLAFNNRLDTIADLLGISRKDKHAEFLGWDLWIEVWKRNPEALRVMEKYNIRDVDVLVEAYYELRPFATNIPNYNLFGVSEKMRCPSCGSTRVKDHGWRHTKTKSYKRYICKESRCRSYFRTDANDQAPRSI